MKQKLSIFLIMLLMPMIVFAGGGDDRPEVSPTTRCTYSVKMTNQTVPITIKQYYCSGECKYKGEWTINYKVREGDWYTVGIKHNKDVTKGPDGFSSIFSTDGSPNIYMPDDVYKALRDKYTCPKNVYFDYSARNEICFDNDGKWCANKFDDWTTEMGTSNEDFVSTSKDQDIQEDTQKQFEEKVNDNVDSDKVLEGETAVENQWTDNINGVKDEAYKNSGGAIPEADQKYYEENSDKVQESAGNHLDKVVDSTKTDTENDYQNGVIDEETYNDRMNTLNQIEQDREAMLDRLHANNFAVQITIVNQNCETLLGDPDVEGTPAYYLVFVFSVIKYVAIVILIVLSIIDFVGAVASHDNDILKKVVRKTLIRAILCVVIFLLPTIIEFILKYFADNAAGLCGIK